MDVVAVGVGGAGGRIVDELHRDDAGRSVSYLAASRVFDTDTSSLGALDRVPGDARHPFGTLEFDGSGADSDADAARDAAADQATELRRELDEVITTTVTGILLVAGLGGGTGPGATPVLAEELTRVYDRPVYCVSVLPTGDDETACENAARGVEALDSVVDCQIAFDNDAWTGEDDSLEDRLPALNRELADRLGSLLVAGEVEAASPVGESVLDETDVAATLDADGLATVGYASAPVSKFRDVEDSLVGRLKGKLLEEVTDAERREAVTSTLRWAVRGQLTMDCDPADSATALVLFSGPADWLHRGAVADGRDWVASRCENAELRSGDAPVPGGSELSVLVVFAGLERAPRIEELQWYGG